MNGASNYITADDLGPVFDLLGQRLKALEDGHGEMKDALTKIIGGFGDAVTSHKKDGFTSMLNDRHGGDLAELGDPYKDIYGSDLASDLIDKLMGGELDENGVADHIGGIKAKFAKLRGIPGEEPKGEAVEVEAPAEKESPDEEAKESPDYQAGEEDALKDVAGFKGPGTDTLKSMLSTLNQGPEILKARAKRR